MHVYQKIATTLVALQNCEASGNTEWAGRHRETLDQIAKALPSGAGFDQGTKINIDESRADRVVLRTAYHHMNEHGMYNGWTEHDVVIKPSLLFGFELTITGRDRDEIKAYIGDVFHGALDAEAE